MTPTRHITFTNAGANGLREALSLSGRDARVISLPDDLTFGPIAPADGLRRQAWSRAHDMGDGAPPDEIEAFWHDALADGPDRVVWTNRRVAREYAGFLEWLSRNGDRAFTLIDLTDIATTSRWKALLGQASPEQIVAGGWLELGRPVSTAARQDLTRLWSRLAADRDALRIVQDGELVAAPPSAFDEALMAATSRYWMRLALVIGTVLAEAMHRDDYNASDYLLEARVRALVMAGRLQAEGEVTLDGGGCQVRRP